MFVFPWPTSTSEVRIWIFALLGYCWLTPHGRVVAGYELLMPEPDWPRIRTCLDLAALGPRAGMSGHRRRGLGVLGPGAVATQQQREVATLQCWHRAIVKDGDLQNLTDVDPALLPPNSTDATHSLGRLPSVFPYLVKTMLALLTLADRIRLDERVMPPPRILFVSAVRADW